MNLENLTYSSVMRELNRSYPAGVLPFMKAFKSAFLEARQEDVDSPESIALMRALQVIKTSSLYGRMMIRQAQSSNAIDVGKNIAKIISFMIEGLDDSKVNYRKILKEKFLSMNSRDVSGKEMPETATLGQIITFVKSVIAGSDRSSATTILSSIVNSL